MKELLHSESSRRLKICFGLFEGYFGLEFGFWGVFFSLSAVTVSPLLFFRGNAKTTTHSNI